ncbi:MAG TPA: GAF domain-containing protein [Polyangiaceae bacterium]|jgi:GAF domain-containing protein|nr:GAF domain-containing protein [Polyangiaceae bacterium]
MGDLDDPRRLAQFRSSLVQLDSDGVLDECVRDAAARAEAPVALVTFVMSKVQLFRAAVGLPPELEMSRAISRCDSFCQFVVQNESAFVVNDARTDPRVPQAMVRMYGITSYVGVPIRAQGEVLGSLCVADGKPRAWAAALVDDLASIGMRVSRRLDQMSSRMPSKAPPDLASPELEDRLERAIRSLLLERRTASA